MGPLSATDAPSLRQCPDCRGQDMLRRADQARDGPTLLEARQGRLPDGGGCGLGGTKVRRAETQLTTESWIAGVYLNKWLTGRSQFSRRQPAEREDDKNQAAYFEVSVVSASLQRGSLFAGPANDVMGQKLTLRIRAT